MLELVDGQLGVGAIVKFTVDFRANRGKGDYTFLIPHEISSDFDCGFVKIHPRKGLSEVNYGRIYRGVVDYLNPDKGAIHVIPLEQLDDNSDGMTREEGIKHYFVQRHLDSLRQDEDGEYYSTRFYSIKHLLPPQK